MRTRIDLDSKGNEVPPDWNIGPPDAESAAFTPDRKRFVGYGDTKNLARAKAEWLRRLTPADETPRTEAPE
jgi:hypothetical protein